MSCELQDNQQFFYEISIYYFLVGLEKVNKFAIKYLQFTLPMQTNRPPEVFIVAINATERF